MQNTIFIHLVGKSVDQTVRPRTRAGVVLRRRELKQAARGAVAHVEAGDETGSSQA